MVATRVGLALLDTDQAGNAGLDPRDVVSNAQRSLVQFGLLASASSPVVAAWLPLLVLGFGG